MLSTLCCSIVLASDAIGCSSTCAAGSEASFLKVQKIMRLLRLARVVKLMRSMKVWGNTCMQQTLCHVPVLSLRDLTFEALSFKVFLPFV